MPSPHLAPKVEPHAIRRPGRQRRASWCAGIAPGCLRRRLHELAKVTIPQFGRLRIVAYPLVIVGVAQRRQSVLVVLRQVGAVKCSPLEATFDTRRALGMRWLLVLLDARRRWLGGGAELLTLTGAQVGIGGSPPLEGALAP